MAYCAAILLRALDMFLLTSLLDWQINELVLEILAEDPSLYMDLKNATLVQDMNGQETVANIIQV